MAAYDIIIVLRIATVRSYKRTGSCVALDGPIYTIIIKHKCASMILIRRASFSTDATAVLEIWREYIVSPSVSPDYQGYEAELPTCPASMPPLWTAAASRGGKRHRGLHRLRNVTDAICEMKRLYVRPRASGSGLGLQLVNGLIGEARQAGYTEMRLDVLAEFEQAHEIIGEAASFLQSRLHSTLCWVHLS